MVLSGKFYHDTSKIHFQYGRTFQPVISKKKNDNWPWFSQESLAILEMKIDLSEKSACVKF